MCQKSADKSADGLIKCQEYRVWGNGSDICHNMLCDGCRYKQTYNYADYMADLSCKLFDIVCENHKQYQTINKLIIMRITWLT
jgi:hypothetical protein